MTANPPQHWLLLRGLSRENRHWGHFVADMQAAFPRAQINTLDLPGTGEFYYLPSPNNINGIMRFVRQQAHIRGWLHQPPTLLALSLGGMVAWEWLQTHPAEIRAATLVNTSFANLSPFYQRLQWQSYGKFASILKQKKLCAREQAIIHLVSNNRSQTAALASTWAAIQQTRPVSPLNTIQQLRAAATFNAGTQPPQIPVLLLNSAGDKLVNPQCSAAIANKWMLPLHTHPWAGHDIALDDGDWLIERLRAWDQDSKPTAP